MGSNMVTIVCDICESSFGTEGEFEAHRASEHVLPNRQPFGHR